MSCKAIIPPAWVAAIKSGICPGCGGNIYDEATKILMEELAAAMEVMATSSGTGGVNAQGIAGWLMSNYRLQKIGDAIPVDKFHDKSNGRPPIDESNLKIPQSFLERSGAAKVIQQNKLRAAAVSPGGNKTKLAQMAALINEEESERDRIELEDNQDYEPQLDEYGEEERGPRLSRNLVNNSSMLQDPNAPPLSVQDLKALSEALVPEARESAFMQEQRLKRVHAQNSVLGGGSIRRSS